MLNAVIEEGAARESDLLAFEIAIERGHPGSVMCSYNRLDSIYACENDVLLNKLLKGDWAYPGWVMSDWGAVHSLGAAVGGLDQESGEQFDAYVFFGQPLKDAVNTGARAGSDSPQVYLTDAHGQARMRLIGWSRVALKPGETRRVTVVADPRLLSDFDVAAHQWKQGGGAYRIAVGANSADLKLTGEARMPSRVMKP